MLLLIKLIEVMRTKKISFMCIFICTSLLISCSVSNENNEELNVSDFSTKKMENDNSEFFDYVDDYSKSFFNIEPFPALTPMFPDVTIDDAYDFQDRLVKELKKGGIKTYRL